jgi:hypothetical protein
LFYTDSYADGSPLSLVVYVSDRIRTVTKTPSQTFITWPPVTANAAVQSFDSVDAPRFWDIAPRLWIVSKYGPQVNRKTNFDQAEINQLWVGHGEMRFFLVLVSFSFCFVTFLLRCCVSASIRRKRRRSKNRSVQRITFTGRLRRSYRVTEVGRLLKVHIGGFYT